MFSQTRKAGRWSIFVGASLILAACSVGPVYEAPSIDLPDRYSILTPVPKLTR